MNSENAPRQIEVIINPAAGQPEPVLAVLHEELTQNGVEWEASVTGDLSEVGDYVSRAEAKNVDLIAVYGGDGTVSAVAAALNGSDLPLAILPGGTGNVMATEMFIPEDLRQACRLLLDPISVRKVDLGRVGDRRFILRVGIGLEAEMVIEAEPEQKSRFGSLAYGLAGIAALQNPQSSLFHIEVDGEKIAEHAVTCLVINSGNLGRPGLRLSPRMKVDDGLLDVVLVRQVDFESVAEVLASVTGNRTAGQSLLHWQGKQIRVQADPARQAEADGEAIGKTPWNFEIEPGKVNLIEGRRQEQL